jgi:predicted lipoprotein with Yx(FWY)xxD motif
MKRFLSLGTALAASLALAACGGGGSSGGAASGSNDTVAVKSIDGLHNVLVDSSGQALYASNVEAGGKVMCTGACESFWKPLTVKSTMPTAAAGVGKLATIKRPDGSRQVTADGKLLYTFTQDSTGEVKGNGFKDDFNGRHFTWNAVLAGGKVASKSDSGGSYGY